MLAEVQSLKTPSKTLQDFTIWLKEMDFRGYLWECICEWTVLKDYEVDLRRLVGIG